MQIKRLILLLSLLYIVLNADLIDEAWKEQQKGNLIRAAILYEKACNNNDYNACGRLAYMNREGKGIKINKKKAANIYAKICEKTGKNCDTLAWMYHEGEGVIQDKQKFFQLSKIACENNDYVGCQFVGHCYRDGDIIRQDKNKALKIFNNLCTMTTHNQFNKEISMLSCTDVGFMYYNNGQASNENIKKAKEYFGKGCDLGSSNACKSYRILNEQGY